MDLQSFAQQAVSAHLRDRTAWNKLVRDAQTLPKDVKSDLLDEIAQQDLRAASRFARDAGVNGSSAARLLRTAATKLDASEISWVVENLVHAMGEERFVRAAKMVSDENRGFEKVVYWARKYLSEDSRRLLIASSKANP